jgi:prepilin-type N-terminal cleavage/methylation domain-containing protein
MKNNYKKAYTLIELSIVLVIISVIISGIVAGKTLASTAKLRKVIKEAQDIINAANAFRDIYGELPGDINNGQVLFGVQGASTAYDKNGNYVNNGNSDGHFNGLPDTGTAGWQPTDQEKMTAFQQLSLAGLIPGQYTGSNSIIAIGTNIPKSSYSPKSGYNFYSDTLGTQYKFGNSLQLYSSTYIINSSDSYYIDNKIDDGLPYVGKVINLALSNGVCVSTILSAATHPLSQYTYIPNSTAICGELHFAFPEYNFNP